VTRSTYAPSEADSVIACNHVTLTLAGIVSCFTALWRVFSFLLTEAWPEAFIPGQRDLLPRFSNIPGGARVISPGMTEMFQRGFKYPKYEPGVIKGQ
jgi:hypothetical protein